MTALQAARRYATRGFAVTPARGKRPLLNDWPNRRLRDEDLPEHFGEGVNIGVLNGAMSVNLIDIDLDAAEALAAADIFLPHTGLEFGRKSKPRSHREYLVDPVPNTAQFQDIDSTMLVELRSTGTQTIWPGSIHPSGEAVEFDSDDEAATVETSALRRAVALTATCALLARHWPRVAGSRHDIANALGGFLLRNGIDENVAVKIVETAARTAGDGEWEDRGRDVRATAETLAKGEPATGGPTLAEMLGDKVAGRIAKWLRFAPAPGSSSKADARPGSQATRLVVFAEEAEFFHTPDREAYASIPVSQHLETWPIRSRAFRQWITRQFYEETRTTPTAQAVNDALAVLEGTALYHGPEARVFTRLADVDGAIYLDLANERWEVVEITASGWRVTTGGSVKFRRTRGMLALSHPVARGSIEALRPFVNVSDENDWRLLVAWLIGALRATGPFPVLALHGEQGSAKSTLARVLRACVDPNLAPLRRPPRDLRDLMIAATNGWVITLDNLSKLPQWLSDALCCLSTGGGLSTRELYTNTEEILFDAMRPMILTGIAEVATSGDLLDRALVVYLPAIAEQQRRTEREFWHAFEQARPGILGALLDAAVVALRELPLTRLARPPRLADFATWVTAAEPGLGWPPRAFMNAYTANRATANETALEDPVADAVRTLVAVNHGPWEGTATQLLRALREDGVTTEEVRKARDWPKKPRTLSGKLRRHAPNLRAVGVHVDFYKSNGSGSSRLITVRLSNGSDSAGESQGAGDASQPADGAAHGASHGG